MKRIFAMYPAHFSRRILACSEEDSCEPLSCDLCRKEIPGSARLTFEGADYTRHFCGNDCLDSWKSGLPGAVPVP